MHNNSGIIKNRFLLQPSSKNKTLFKSFNEKVEREILKEEQEKEIKESREYKEYKELKESKEGKIL